MPSRDALSGPQGHRSRASVRLALATALLAVSMVVSAQQAQEALETPDAPKPPMISNCQGNVPPWLAAPASTPSQVPQAISAEAVTEAVETVKADPLMPGKQTVKYLRFKPEEKKEKLADEPESPPLRWWLDLLDNLSTGLRIVLWVVAAAVFVFVLLRLREWVKLRGFGPAVMAPAPTHVGTLDIRPESLPADIGGAARSLWQRGDMRAALSLLYRGALSRLVHGHGVPIRAATTENECLALAAGHLAAPSSAYLTRLVQGWQAVAYAQRQLEAAQMEQLCDGFDAGLPAGAAR